MSLDFYLISPNTTTDPCICTCGHEHTVTTSRELFSANITHNLNAMAREAGIYECLWRPSTCTPPIVTASQCVPILEEGLALMCGDPERFEAFNSPNGWGIYENFVPWVKGVLAACKRYPHALVRTST